MSKLSRNVLKEIVKECIIEIFEESFFTQGSLVNESRQTKKREKRKKRPNVTESKRRHLDNISYNQSNKQSGHNKNFEDNIERITSNLTNDPVMANIFKDTASTTLQKQTPGRNSLVAGGDAAAMKVSNSDPTELFSESASKWATLAFAESIKR